MVGTEETILRVSSLRIGATLKCAASSSPRGEATGFLRRDPLILILNMGFLL